MGTRLDLHFGSAANVTTARYLIPVTVAEVFLTAFALETIRRKTVQRVVAYGFLVFVVGFNIWYPKEHAKLDIRSTLTQVNALVADDDVIYAESPLIFFESIYYSQDRSRVFLYNPQNVAFPWYVGDIVVKPEQMAQDIPTYPARAFLIHEDGTFTITYRAPISATEPQGR